MPKPQFSWKAGLAALILGVVFAVTSIHLGDGEHRKLANLFFALAVIGEVVFMVFAVMWSMGKAWEGPPQPPQNMPGQRPPGMPPGMVIGKPPQSPQVQPGPPRPPAA